MIGKCGEFACFKPVVVPPGLCLENVKSNEEIYLLTEATLCECLDIVWKDLSASHIVKKQPPNDTLNGFLPF